MNYFLFILFGLLSGSIMFGRIFSAKLGVDIVSESDDHNPGTANVYKILGFKYAASCLVCDILKGFIPVFFASKLLDTENLFFSAVIVSPIVGSAFSIFLKFHGAKSIAVAYGTLIGISDITILPFCLMVLCVLFFAAVVVVEPNSLKIILSSIIFAAACGINIETVSIKFACFIISGILIFTHIRGYNKKPFKISLFGIRKAA